MNSAQRQIWENLQSWNFGEPDADPGHSFVDKLAKKTGWSVDHAKRIVEEFRRFVLIWACFERERCTPSIDVDEAWHLALQFTQRYALLCAQFLRAFKHHYPWCTEAERRTLPQEYSWTLDRYQELFGEKAPDDIWTDSFLTDHGMIYTGDICG